MDSITTYIALVLGLAMRLGLPVAFTVMLIVILRRMDDRWQQESEFNIPVIASIPRCWEKHDCPPEKRDSCAAYKHPEIPCWQLFRNRDGVLREECLGCQEFIKASIPVVS